MNQNADTPRWIGKDSQFGYSPYINPQMGFQVVNSTTVNKYIPPGKFFSRKWRLHILNSSTSALMQLLLGGRGVHLGDAGGFGKRDDIGYFKPVSPYAKEKSERTKLLKVRGRSYMEMLQDASVQRDYIEATKKYIRMEAAKYKVQFVLASPFMAYSCNCMTAGTLEALKGVCEDVGALLIIDETLGSLRLGPLCSFMLAPGFTPHAFILGSKTYSCASLWVDTSLKPRFERLVPNLSGSHVLEFALMQFEKILRYLASLKMQSRVDNAESLRQHFGIDGGGLFWWVTKSPSKLISKYFADYRFKHRVLIPLDFNFSALKKEIKNEVKAKEKKRKKAEKRKQQYQKAKKRKKLEPVLKVFDVQASVLEFIRKKAETAAYSNDIVGSQVVQGEYRTGRMQTRHLPSLKSPLKKLLANSKYTKAAVENPIVIWNQKERSPQAQALHLDGATSMIVPATESGRQLDFLVTVEGRFKRIRIHIPYGKAVMFSGNVFHGGAPGRAGLDDACVHCNINETETTNQEFQFYFLHKFDTWKGRNLFADGVVGPDGRLDRQRLLGAGSLSINMFEDLMVGAYVNCCEVDGHSLEPGAEYISCSYREYMASLFMSKIK